MIIIQIKYVHGSSRMKMCCWSEAETDVPHVMLPYPMPADPPPGICTDLRPETELPSLSESSPLVNATTKKIINIGKLFF